MKVHIIVCKGCGLAFETKRKSQTFHDYKCFVRYKIRTGELWKGKNKGMAELQRLRYEGAKAIEKAANNKNKRNDSQAGENTG